MITVEVGKDYMW